MAQVRMDKDVPKHVRKERVNAVIRVCPHLISSQFICRNTAKNLFDAYRSLDFQKARTLS